MVTGAQSSRRRQVAILTRRRCASARAVWRAGCVLAVGALAVLAPQVAPAATEPVTLGVVDFYAITPVESVSGLIPERTAADDLHAILARTSDGRYTMIPRDVMQRAEAELHWNEADVVHFARLKALADRVHADRLAVGWIQALSVEGQSTEEPPFLRSNTLTGFASLVLQLFDASQGRLVAEVRGTGYSVAGVVRARVLEEALDNALEPLARPLLSAPPK